MTDRERIRGIRCSLVVGEVLTELMQEVMEQSNHDPQKFCNLAFSSVTFKKILTAEEYNVLQTLQTDGYRKLDINIMYKIAKFFRMFYVEPTQTWKGQPQADNISIGDDMQRIKRARDFYGHNICPAMTEEDMEAFFETFSEVGKRADKYLSKEMDCSYEIRIVNYKTCNLDKKTKTILKENDELKNCVICQIPIKPGINLNLVCDEEMKKKIKIECTKCNEDDWIQIQLYIEGIKDPKHATTRITIHKDEINNQSTGIKLDEALDGSVVLHLLVKHVVLQDDLRILREMETFIRLLTQVADLDYSSERQCYLIITAAEVSLDIDSSFEEEDVNVLEDVETGKENLILNIQVKKEVLENDELIRDRLSDFMKVLADEMNGVEVTAKQEMRATMQLKELSLNMADKATICSICDKIHIYKQSTDWCFECEQALCAECKTVHGILNISKNHDTIPITDYQTLDPSISSIVGYCSGHHEKYQMFCQTDDKPLCPQCIEEHSNCRDVKPLSKLITNVKTSETFRDAEQCLIDIHENILNIEDTIKDKIKILNDQKEIIMSKITKIRQEINKHLDQIEVALRTDVDDIEQKARKELETTLILLEEKKEQNSSSKQQLENVRQHASDLQTFFSLRQISSVATTTEIYLQSIIDNGHVDKIALKFSVNKNLKSILDEIQTFGSVHAEKNPRDLNLVKQKVKQAQLVDVQSKSIQDIKLKLTKSITNNITQMCGCDILPDGNIIFCDSVMKRIVGTDANGKSLFEVPLQPYHAFDVTSISDKTVAVTTGGYPPNGIIIIDISNCKILQFIPKDYCCCGITSVNGSLVYCVKGKRIEMMDVKSKNTRTILKCNLPKFSYIAAYNDKLYYTNHKTSNTVTCCDMKGNTIWTFTDENVLSKPHGISVDNEGRVYVVNNGGNGVIVLSADGQQSRKILSKEDGLYSPVALHYERNMHRLLVANFTNTSFLYEVSK